MSRPRERALVLLNPSARRGTAVHRFRAVLPAVRERLRPSVVPLDRQGRWRRIVAAAVRRGDRTFVAAGGDGTVNALATTLLAARGALPLDALRLGAIGLGSSNDFHKPFGLLVHGVPLRLDLTTVTPRDLVDVDYETPTGETRRALFLVSASVGATARANAMFNSAGRLLRLLKQRYTPAAILYAALRAIGSHRNVVGRIRIGSRCFTVTTEISNLSLMKTRHLSGNLIYDTPVEPADGLMAVNLCHYMGRLQLLQTLVGLMRGRFLGQPGTRCWRTDRVLLTLREPVDLELDGEVVRARRARFTTRRERMALCT